MHVRIQPRDFFVPSNDLRGGDLALGPGFQRQRGDAPAIRRAFDIGPFFPGCIVRGTQLVQDGQGTWFIAGVESR